MKNKQKQIKCVSGTEVNIKESIIITHKVIVEAEELLDNCCFYYSNLFFSMTQGVKTRYVEGIVVDHYHRHIITHGWNIYKGKMVDISLIANVMYHDSGNVNETDLKKSVKSVLYYPVHTYRKIDALVKEIQKGNYIFYKGNGEKHEEMNGLITSMAKNLNYSYYIT